LTIAAVRRRMGLNGLYLIVKFTDIFSAKNILETPKPRKPSRTPESILSYKEDKLH
jgi:hypothetical protein